MTKAERDDAEGKCRYLRTKIAEAVEKRDRVAREQNELISAAEAEIAMLQAKCAAAS